MKYLLLALLVLSTTAIAAEKKVVAQTTKKNTVVEQNSNTLDVTPADKTQERADETALYTDAPEVKAKVTCKTKDGHELKAGDKGYKACLKKVKASKHDPKAEVKVEFEKQ
ncbi:hypothetical protein SHI21_15160 [Bacteriovorax sp. PP10]|uniref:Uncharacterized protein n=1 Tax=Bacteriovorax antarcticus TaxID=3088717 RepID=A0ABU5VWX4_9BACT|nr:hypothetical protein [Bacteriovorax sp. PP10]MEA9357566.1 hypothetical protein [Bacteriovorax sp. PP10]